MKDGSVEKSRVPRMPVKGFDEGNKQWWDAKRGARFVKRKYGKFYHEGRMEK